MSAETHTTKMEPQRKSPSKFKLPIKPQQITIKSHYFTSARFTCYFYFLSPIKLPAISVTPYHNYNPNSYIIPTHFYFPGEASSEGTVPEPRPHLQGPGTVRPDAQ